MTTRWKYCINMIISAADRDWCNTFWTSIAPEGDKEANTFSVKLAPTQNSPVSHYGAGTMATDEMLRTIQTVFGNELATLVMSIQPNTQDDWSAFLSRNGLVKLIQ